MSVECLDAIEMLLKKNPKERISIFDFLQHPWIKKYKRWKETKTWGTKLKEDDTSVSCDTLSEESEQSSSEPQLVPFANEEEGPEESPLFGSPDITKRKAKHTLTDISGLEHDAIRLQAGEAEERKSTASLQQSQPHRYHTYIQKQWPATSSKLTRKITLVKGRKSKNVSLIRAAEGEEKSILLPSRTIDTFKQSPLSKADGGRSEFRVVSSKKNEIFNSFCNKPSM